MFNLLILIMIMMLISLIFLMMNFILYKKTLKNREKSSPFECGFDPLSNNRIPFSIHFFLISLIFLIFDIEITLLIPIISILPNLNKTLMISSMFFFLILIVGLYIEFLEQSIDWKK